MVLRTEIEKALDEIISNENGMRFQGLAVVLAKIKWPEFIGCERKKDLGLDGYLPASLAKDGIAKGLACSLTATLNKITSDIDSFRDTYKDISVLVFATPGKVSNLKASKWAETVYSKYKLELISISREDVITDLMVPSNASLCRTHLGISVAVEPEISDLVTKTRDAISETLEGWRFHLRLAGKPLIGVQAVKLDHDNRETSETLDLSGLNAALQEGRRLVLEGPAGRGKTTTLVQLATNHLAHGEIPFPHRSAELEQIADKRP